LTPSLSSLPLSLSLSLSLSLFLSACHSCHPCHTCHPCIAKVLYCVHRFAKICIPYSTFATPHRRSAVLCAQIRENMHTLQHFFPQVTPKPPPSHPKSPPSHPKSSPSHHQVIPKPPQSPLERSLRSEDANIKTCCWISMGIRASEKHVKVPTDKKKNNLKRAFANYREHLEGLGRP